MIMIFENEAKTSISAQSPLCGEIEIRRPGSQPGWGKAGRAGGGLTGGGLTAGGAIADQGNP